MEVVFRRWWRGNFKCKTIWSWRQFLRLMSANSDEVLKPLDCSECFTKTCGEESVIWNYVERLTKLKIWWRLREKFSYFHIACCHEYSKLTTQGCSLNAFKSLAYTRFAMCKQISITFQQAIKSEEMLMVE